MKDALDLAYEHIDMLTAKLDRIEKKHANLQKVEEAASDALHKMRNECQDMVLKAQHKHFRCACEHGCPTEYAV